MRYIMLIIAFIAVSNSFANNQSLNLSGTLGKTWKAQQSMHAQSNKGDVAIVYGGKDISFEPNIETSITAV